MVPELLQQRTGVRVMRRARPVFDRPNVNKPNRPASRPLGKIGNKAISEVTDAWRKLSNEAGECRSHNRRDARSTSFDAHANIGEESKRAHNNDKTRTHTRARMKGVVRILPDWRDRC